jgi:hypothetical protein
MKLMIISPLEATSDNRGMLIYEVEVTLSTIQDTALHYICLGITLWFRIIIIQRILLH